jgi:hypothetical protein
MVFPNRRFGSMMLLSILAPVSLLAAFRLVGVIPEPQAPETITLETMQWQMERPSEHTGFYDNTRSVYADDFISISVDTPRYVDNDDWSGDFLDVWVLFNGSISTVVARFQPIDPSSVIDIDEEVFQNPPRYPTAVANMTLVGVKGVGTNSTEAYVKARATDSPSSLAVVTYWLFYDVIENNKDHKLEMTFEVTYFNGTIYRRIIAPATLEVLAGGA